MTKTAFIGGDWGTSRLRLFLCDGDGAILDRAEGPGIAEAGDACARILAEQAAAWDQAHGKLPAILGGMVGSTIGWREVPYVPCPTKVSGIAQAALRFESGGREVVIVPGLSCRNASGIFDVMRGEETQLAGALRLFPKLAAGRHLFCLPGTHAKWALLEDGAVTQFQSALSGELFDLLSRHSVLARGSDEARAESQAFALGLRTVAANRQAGLLHLLFSTRSRQLAGEIAKADAASYLSGLVVGEDVAGALTLFGRQSRVVLVCTPSLGKLYARALAETGIDAAFVDGGNAAHAGIASLHASLFGESRV